GWTRLREFLADATRLGQEYDAKLKAGDWEAARTIALRMHAEFENTEVTSHCLVPVMITTRPGGAQLKVNGALLQQNVGGVQKPLLTPAMVLCSKAPANVVAHLDGFEPRTFVLDAKAGARMEVV